MLWILDKWKIHYCKTVLRYKRIDDVTSADYLFCLLMLEIVDGEGKKEEEIRKKTRNWLNEKTTHLPTRPSESFR